MARRRPAKRWQALRGGSVLPIVMVGSVLGMALATADPKVKGIPASHEVSWESEVGYNYQVEVSSDLQLWEDTAIVEPGTGELISYSLSNPAAELFYRVRSTVGLFDATFLLLPEEGAEVDLVDGVCFSFDLSVLPGLPEKIRIYKREANLVARWEQIGELTEFATIDGIRFVRGSAVWIPELVGDYEVRAAVVDGEGVVLGTATRSVTVDENEGPVVTITGGPMTPSESGVAATFTTTVTDTEDAIRRVEFYDNGILLGIDRQAPFGNRLESIEGNLIFQILLRGVHQITARAYDARGAASEFSAPFEIEVTGGNARPQVQVLSPANGLVVELGESFDIEVDVTDDDGIENIDSVSANDLATFSGTSDFGAPFGPLTINTTGWALGSHLIKVRASDLSFDVSYPVYVQIYVLAPPGAEFAQSLVSTIVDEETAVPDNETFVGVQASSGIFSEGLEAGLQMDSGVLLTSGLFHLWNADDLGEGTDENDDPMFFNAEEPGDPVLENRVAGRETNDAVILSFDVFCVNSQLEMEFQFGSEEYVDYVSDGAEEGCFNDAFMVTIDDVVVSLLPDCSGIVAVNNIHPAVSVAESFGCLSVDLPSVNEHLFLDDDGDIDPIVKAPATQVEYDGMTVRLRLHAFVKPNESHRVRIVIADVNDDQLDSGLFLQEDSVRTVKPGP